MKRKSIRFHFFGHEKLLQDLFKFKSKFYLLRSIIERDTFVQLNTFYLLFPLDLNRQEKVFRFKNNRFQVIYTRNNLFLSSWKNLEEFSKVSLRVSVKKW